jgi:putative tryptophan/tyrosine transport system substrate-binding protein
MPQTASAAGRQKYPRAPRQDRAKETFPCVRTLSHRVRPIAATIGPRSVRLEILTASTESDLGTAFATMAQQRVGALILAPDPFFISRHEQLVDFAARYAVPAIYPSRMFTDVGGLRSYGSSVRDLTQQLGIYIGKILKGAKSPDPPIQQSTKTGDQP